jgi:hypothetical protein
VQLPVVHAGGMAKSLQGPGAKHPHVRNQLASDGLNLE